MNHILFTPSDRTSADEVVLDSRVATHLRKVLKSEVGDRVRVGELNGRCGFATIKQLGADNVVLQVELDEEAVRPGKLTLAVALPRPPTLQKVLHFATTMGVERLIFFHARRVEKSYWQSHALRPAELQEHLTLALEQARTTVPPELEFIDRFLPFAQERVALAREQGPVYYADPLANTRCPCDEANRATVVLGPEGGFVDFEREALEAAGCHAISLGPRILRVEVACAMVMARMSAFH